MANKKELIDKLERLHKQLEDVNDNTSYQEAKQNMELVGEIFSLVAPPFKIVFDTVVDFGKIGTDVVANREFSIYLEYARQGDIDTAHLMAKMNGISDENIKFYDSILNLEKIIQEKKDDLKKYDEQSSLNPKLEIAILSDTTGSMSGEINSVKAQAKNIVETAFSKDENARIGVFGYNDPDVQTFADLTNNKSAIISAINALYARDGGDTPEMTYKGLINAASSSWSPNADKKIIIFGDAPAKDTYNKAEAYALLSGGSSDEPMARLALPA